MKRLRFRKKSLRTNITVLLMAAGIIPVVILAAVLLRFYESQIIEGDVIRITSQAQVLSNEIITSGYLTDQTVENISSEITAFSNAFGGRIMVMDSSGRIVKDTYEMYEGRTFIWDSIIMALDGKSGYIYDRSTDYILVTIPLMGKENPEEVSGALLITQSTETIGKGRDFFWSLTIILTIVAVFLVIAAAMIAGDYLTRPLIQIASGIRDIESNIQTDELNIDTYSETLDICDSFNSYCDRQRILDNSRQEFVSNVSHELKTPLTSMKVLADSINSMGDQAPVEMYREFMTDIAGEIDRETRIINELLSLVKMDKSAGSLEVTPVNINDLLEVLLKRLKPIAGKKDVELVLESFRPVTAEVDEVKFALAIMNLIENAIKYNNDGGWVHVSLNSDHRYCFIRVEDNGLGIPEDSLDHIFERFYRADKSHSSTISGTGLGLAITHDAIALHHGEIAVNSELGEGTTFDVRIPLNYIEEEEDS